MRRPADYEDGSLTAAPLEKTGTGVVGLLRWFWRQLSSMRVALILLLLLAVAAIPGSLVPQRIADPNGVEQFKADNPELFKVLDAFPIQAFDVYSSVWFSAIYLLLFVSLVACIVPRIGQHYKALRQDPPRTPARLNRMVGFTEKRYENPGAAAAEQLQTAHSVIAAAAGLLKGQRYRTVVRETETRHGKEVSVSAERGYLRETGNLLFHIGLVGVLVTVALGSGYKLNGQKALYEGEVLVNSLIDYDSVTTGRFFDPASLDPFRVRLDAFEVDYLTPEDTTKTADIGRVEDYQAKVTVFAADGTSHEDVIKVNHPLRTAGLPLYLVANGYAPHLEVRNSAGEVVFDEPTLFIPQDTNLTSLGVVKLPHGLELDGQGTQVGLRGFFYPTKADTESGAFTSNYPDLENPLLTLDVYAGDLGINSGIPQSVYALDTSQMQQLTGRQIDVASLQIGLGQTVELPEGMGTITLKAVPRYAAFEIMDDPTAVGVLVSSMLAFGGLIASLFVPRRRLWVKAVLAPGVMTLQYAGLARGDDPSLDAAVAALREKHEELL